ncbi:MAG: hypothetical protein R2734_14040 [Nocardioides sp.]
MVQPPYPDEPPRSGAGGIGCFNCEGGDAVRVWENDRWKLAHPSRPAGLPLVLWLSSKHHLDYPDMDDDMAAEYGRISVWLCRIMSNLPHRPRARGSWGDGSGTCTCGSSPAPPGSHTSSARWPSSGTRCSRPLRRSGAPTSGPSRPSQ